MGFCNWVASAWDATANGISSAYDYTKDKVEAAWDSTCDATCAGANYVADKAVSAWDYTCDATCAGASYVADKAVSLWDYSSDKACSGANYVIDQTGELINQGFEWFKADGTYLTAQNIENATQNELHNAREHQLCANLAETCYSDEHSETVGEARLNHNYVVNNQQQGFHACVYETNDTIYIVYRGTDDFADGINDSLMFGYALPPQYNAARALYERVASSPENKDKRFVVTGHSLGGSLAQLVACTNFEDNIKRPTAVTFNAFGTKNMQRNRLFIADSNLLLPYNRIQPTNNFSENPNIINYAVQNDCIAYTREHPGSTFYFPENKDDVLGFQQHLMHNFTKNNALEFFVDAQKYLPQNT